MHVFSRFASDGFSLNLPPDYRQRPARRELDQVAKTIRAVLASPTKHFANQTLTRGSGLE